MTRISEIVCQQFCEMYCKNYKTQISALDEKKIAVLQLTVLAFESRLQSYYYKNRKQTELYRSVQLVGVNGRSLKFYPASKVRTTCTFYDLYNGANIISLKKYCSVLSFQWSHFGIFSDWPQQVVTTLVSSGHFLGQELE